MHCQVCKFETEIIVMIIGLDISNHQEKSL